MNQFYDLIKKSFQLCHEMDVIFHLLQSTISGLMKRTKESTSLLRLLVDNRSISKTGVYLKAQKASDRLSKTQAFGFSWCFPNNSTIAKA
jgi:hypothetical protein